MVRMKRTGRGRLAAAIPLLATGILLGAFAYLDYLDVGGRKSLQITELEAFIQALNGRLESAEAKSAAELGSLSSQLASSSAQVQKLKQELAAVPVCADRHAVQAPSQEKDKSDPDFAAFLRKVAINNEVLISVSNQNLAGPGGMLEGWVRGVKRAGIKNALVVALDDQTKQAMDRLDGFPAFRMDVEIPETQKSAGSNHAISAIKFRIIRRFLALGYSVFLSDVDVLFLENPFKYLIRDSDLEGMSDGWDNATAYGYNDVADDPAMGWGRYAHSMRVFVINSGTFYIRATPAAMALLDLVIHRLETEGGWDQAVFNECIFFPNRPAYKDPGVTRRVLDYLTFINSKTLFKRIRHEPELQQRPVLIHLNSHPEKFERLKAVEARYVGGDLHALDPWPDGSGMPQQR